MRSVEKNQLEKLVYDLQTRIETQEKAVRLLVRSNKQLIEWTDSIVDEQSHYKQNCYFELNDPRITKQSDYWYPEIASIEETANLIINEKKSIARFGDGEFSAIAGRIRHRFQTDVDEKLSKRLLEVLHAKNEKLMVAIADNYGNLDDYSEQTQREIRCYMNREVRMEHLQLLEKGRKYYNAYVTRPYVMYRECNTDAPKQRFERLKKIWKDRDCVFVEGKYTALGVGNDLFSGAASIERIVGPAENAFRRYEEILECCMNQPKDKLFLLALGPSATVLTYDLCNAGYQAVDIGHIDLEYEWFLKGKGFRTLVKGKYNNEINDNACLSEIKDTVYAEQVLFDLS